MRDKHIKLYVARRERGLYQKDIARQLAMHPQSYYEKESGRKDFTLREAKMLAKIFNCTLNDLFGEDAS
ncbi:helix-turn-helix transcriptional regulator [Virgibacillus siamensis]|uniref:helix-turn-helix transcriptional regulator n=1 Tax=Virgibacillus siamensis TaxID=480071 RepID=UPI002481BEDC|nr:helix-turn-helix domain-containing protein [Virgibacillus siamensis]